jgi:hypothetical protein
MMNKHQILLAGFWLFVGQTCHAQSFFQHNPTQTYLRLCSGDSAGSHVIALTSASAAACDVVKMEQIGAISIGIGQPDSTARGITGVFSSSTSIGATNILNRVTDAIDTGPDYATQDACGAGGTATNISQDFYVPGVNSEHHPEGLDYIIVRVPPNATHIFISADDSFWSDNSDANNDYGLSITKLCRADLDGNGLLNVNDFVAFQNAYSAGTNLADCDCRFAQRQRLHVLPDDLQHWVPVGDHELEA